MDNTLLIGTGNPDKAAELMRLLEGSKRTLKTLKDFPAVPAAVEDGATFEANALKKAAYYGGWFGVACVADDSGLMVDALGGAPGVLSARYAGEGRNYAEHNAKLLSALAGAPWEERTARFVCCAALIQPGSETHIEKGLVEGHIAFEPRGEHGFGYDPLFVPAGYEQTFGELPLSTKQRISHRAQAFTRMRDYLASSR